jgi:hypothetical protein
LYYYYSANTKVERKERRGGERDYILEREELPRAVARALSQGLPPIPIQFGTVIEP